MTVLPKVLAIDIGNSFTKMGCFIGEILSEIEVFPTEKEDFEALTQEIQGNASENYTMDGIVVSSVVPAVKLVMEKTLQTVFTQCPIVWLERETLQSLTYGSMDFSQYAPQQLGTDRVANIVGGYTHYLNQKLMVCDFGTTATFDMVEPNGLYLGGAIAPGPKKFQSLLASNHAAQLFEVDVFTKPHETPGLSTQACLENGLHYGYKGLILEIVGNLLLQAGWPLSQVTFVFTGGYAQPVSEMVSFEISKINVASDLTLQGLYEIWKYNATESLASKSV